MSLALLVYFVASVGPFSVCGCVCQLSGLSSYRFGLHCSSSFPSSRLFFPLLSPLPLSNADRHKVTKSSPVENQPHLNGYWPLYCLLFVVNTQYDESATTSSTSAPHLRKETSNPINASRRSCGFALLAGDVLSFLLPLPLRLSLSSLTIRCGVFSFLRKC